MKKSDKNGAQLFYNLNDLAALTIAWDKENSANYILYETHRNGGSSVFHTNKVLASNVLTLGASNQQGTQVVNGGTDVVQMSFQIH